MNNPKQILLELKCKECGKKLSLSLPVYITEEEWKKTKEEWDKLSMKFK